MASVANLALVAVVFSLLLSAPFFQRSRCYLAYLTTPLLWVFALQRAFGGQFVLADELTFYASCRAASRARRRASIDSNRRREIETGERAR